jgi:uncharacterized protein (TIGR00251 family)
MELSLVESAGRTRLRLRVRAGASRSAVHGAHGGALKLGVTAAPEKGKANRAVIALLAEALGVPAASVELVSGQTSPDKVVSIGLSAEQVRRRLGRLLG